MFLKSLILRGFKTFADLTEIELAENARITAIVGPNGCGKSNLMDAVRWALGEDNPRELRVGSLSDIIFSGTGTRKPLSLAEVSMIFDNTSGRFRVPFSDVAIKRRTFREGESEFFLNKNACRLKDIKDLLLDTGLGEATYSIITQGKVDAILSSKGEERRAVFEEAAGINKYKTRKASAEKKMIAAEQNLLRISDLKVEVGERIITLEDQAKKAREYLDLQSRVKNLDLALCKRLIAGFLEKKDSLFAELDKIKKEAEAKKEVEEKDAVILAELKERHRAADLAVDEILVRLDQEKDRLRDIELNRRFAEMELQRDEKALENNLKQAEEIKQKIAELAAALEEKESDTPLAHLLAGAMESTNKLVETLSSIVAFFDKNKSLTLSVGSAVNKKETFKLKLEMLAEEEGRLTQEKERLEGSIAAFRGQLAASNQQIDESKDKGRMLEELKQKREEKESLARSIAELEEKIQHEGRSERQNLSEETSLEVALAKLEGEHNAIRDRLLLEYNVTLEELAVLPLEAANLPKMRKEIEEGKHALRALEPVNLLAIEEFDREKERLSFIEAQLMDLNSARENLQILIVELDQKAEQTFLTAMQELSVVFSETFSRLFVGGEAKITLAPGVSALEAEIEISVRPSGRRWHPLTLLSGGERSLSAIAILFSLLKLRPSPFCFLDEVDAALDDANIGRFTEMLKDFSAQSQILVITHNKQTMAIADNIYGVTMEEPGITKVISMRLAEAAVA
jgi:chromosome segregation protein